LLLAAVALLVSIAATIALHGARAAAPRHGPDQTRLILRLSDLPPGYLNVELQEEQGERILCSRLTHSNDTPPKMAKFVVRFHPRGCIGAYDRLFAVPGQPAGPALVGTGVLPMGSDKAANAAWQVVPELLGRLMHDRQPHPLTAPEKIGSRAELFHTAQPRFYPFFRKIGPTAAFLVWRSDNTLAVVMTIGQSFAEDDQAAVELARRQQTHIRRPTRYTRAERFDGEVALDDPTLEIPAYWLGRNFRPGNGLTDNRLFESYVRDTPEAESREGGFREAPGAPLHIGYENIWLDTWTPATWSVFADSRTGKTITTWKCTRTKTIALPEGTATIFGGYDQNFARCPKQGPEAFTAWVDVGGVKVVVNAPPAPDFIETVNPFGSFKGMEAIVRGLRLRPKPVYPAG
jgi:hypothetical protein